jgi:predicted HicB family RNase H-like nuclease
MPKAAVQTTVRVPQDVYEQAAEAARAAGISLNAWLVEAIREKLAGTQHAR